MIYFDIRGKMSVLRTGSHPADINRFRSHTENELDFIRFSYHIISETSL